MAHLEQLSLALRALLRTYPWRPIDPVPCSPLRKPIAECRIALVTSAGLVPPGQVPLDEAVRAGNYSCRVIPGDIDAQRLEEHHRSSSFDHAGIECDRKLALQLDRLRPHGEEVA